MQFFSAIGVVVALKWGECFVCVRLRLEWRWFSLKLCGWAGCLGRFAPPLHNKKSPLVGEKHRVSKGFQEVGTASANTLM